MYDYATITKQNEIITEIQNTNENIETLTDEINKTNQKIEASGTLIALLLCIWLLKSFIEIITGLKK